MATRHGTLGRAVAAAARDARVAVPTVLGLAALLRGIRLDSGLWYDEVVTLVEYVRLSTADLVTTYASLNNHILFSVLARGSISLFGESAWALRLPAAVFGVASIAALWLLGRQVASRGEALLASLFLAVSYHHVWFSQNARGYTALLLLSLLATSLFLHGVRHRSPGAWLGYALVLALGLYTHLSGAFVFAAHGLVYLVLLARARPASGRAGAAAAWPGVAGVWPLVGFGLGGLAALLLYAALVPQILEAVAVKSGADSVVPKVGSWTDPLWTALEILRGLNVGFGSLAAAAAAGLLGAAGMLSYARRDPLATALMVLPAPIALVLLSALSFHVWPRYFFVSIGFAALMIVRGAFVSAGLLARLAPGRPEPAWLGTALAGLVIAASASSLTRNYQVPKQDYAGARDFVLAQRRPTEPVVAVGLAIFPYRSYYAPEWLSAESPAELEAVRAGSPDLWLVYTFPTHLRSIHPEVFARIEADFEVVRAFPGTVGDGTVYVCRSRRLAQHTQPART